MKKLFKIFTFVFLLATVVSQLFAQTNRYVVSAELHLSMTHPLWPDVFLNGHQLVDAQEHVFDRTSNIDLSLTKEQLCYFTSVNCLALEVPQTLGSSTGTNASIGLAYVLKVVYSDNSTDWITSDQGKTRRFFIKKNALESSGWTIAGFEDQTWPLSRIFTPPSMAAALMNPQTNLPAKYLPTFKDTQGIYLTLGQKMLFRRKYFRDVTAPPDCGEPVSKLAPLKVQPMPSPVETAIIVPTLTFTPQPTLAFTATPTSVFTMTPTSTLVWTPTALPTSTPYANGHYQEPLAQPSLASRLVVLTQVPTPHPKIHHKLKRLATLTTRANGNYQEPLAQPNLASQLVVSTQVPDTPTMTPTATFTAIVMQDSSMAVTIVFAAPPVNINASFADGPGVYRLEIVDAKGTHINTLYDQQVVLEKNIWITWDGTNDEGRLMGVGNYIARLSKNGVLIEKIALTWIIPNASQSKP